MNNFIFLTLMGIAKTSFIIVSSLLPIVCVLALITGYKEDRNWFRKACDNTLIKIWEL